MYGNCLLIGNWGSGKTTAALTAPKPILFLDTDDKLHKMVNAQALLKSGEVVQWPINEPLSGMSLKSRALMSTKPGDKVTQPRPKGYLKLADMIQKLQDGGCVIDGKKVATVVLDSYTSMDEHCRRFLMAMNATNTVTQPLYGVLLLNFEELNDCLLHLPANVIFIAHHKADKDNLTGRVSYEPLINGSMSSKIGKSFEEVYAMTKQVRGGNVKYFMDTVGDGMKACRTSRELPKEMEPDFSKIFV